VKNQDEMCFGWLLYGGDVVGSCGADLKDDADAGWSHVVRGIRTALD
jgi:hypothetical protein